jgi:hypothetical protein
MARNPQETEKRTRVSEHAAQIKEWATLISALAALATAIISLLAATSLPAWALAYFPWPLIVVTVALAIFSLIMWARTGAGPGQGRTALSRFKRLFSLHGPFLPIFFVVLATFLVMQLHRTSQSLRAQTDGLSTKFEGMFPTNLERIVSLINGTKSELRIAADRLAYGAYSDPDSHEAYRRAIKECVNEGNEVNVIRFSRSERDSATRKQFKGDKAATTEAAWTEFATSDEWNNFFASFKPSVRPGDMGAFIEFIENNFEVPFHEEMANRTNVRLADLGDAGRMPMFIWIRDDDEAVFSFYDLQGKAEEVAFYTTEKQLIQMLKRIFDYYSSRLEDGGSASPATMQADGKQ